MWFDHSFYWGQRLGCVTAGPLCSNFPKKKKSPPQPEPARNAKGNESTERLSGACASRGGGADSGKYCDLFSQQHSEDENSECLYRPPRQGPRQFPRSPASHGGDAKCAARVPVCPLCGSPGRGAASRSHSHTADVCDKQIICSPSPLVRSTCPSRLRREGEKTNISAPGR